MKIAIADNNGRKFSDDMIRYWQNQGHEVKYEPGANPALMDWADVYWVELWDSNIHCLTDYIRDNNYTPKCKIICRPIDWDIWVRGVRTQWRVDLVDKFVCISKLMFDKLMEEKDDETGNPINWNGKMRLIEPGLDIDRFPLKTNKTDGSNIGMVTGNMWEMKGPMLGLEIFNILREDVVVIEGEKPDWKLHIRGQLSETAYHKSMYPYYLESRHLENVVKIHEQYPDMNMFYEQIDILLVPSLKEAFSYATAEALAKGIPCVINDFMGSKDIWPKSMIYERLTEAALKISEAHNFLKNPECATSMRRIIETRYTLDRMMKEANEHAGIK